MAVPVQRTWTTGEVVTAAEFNSNVRDAVNFLLASPRCVLGKSGNYSVTDSTSPICVLWDVEYVDSDTMHAAGLTSRMTSNTAGRFEYEFMAHWPQFTTNISTIMCGIAKNVDQSTGTWSGGKFVEDTRQATGNNNGGFYGSTGSCRGDSFMNSGDWVTFWIAQAGSGATFNCTPGSIPFSIFCSGRWISST